MQILGLTPKDEMSASGPRNVYWKQGSKVIPAHRGHAPSSPQDYGAHSSSCRQCCWLMSQLVPSSKGSCFTEGYSPPQGSLYPPNDYLGTKGEGIKCLVPLLLFWPL